MPLRIDRIDTEVEIFRKEADGPADATTTGGSVDADLLGTIHGRAALRETLRPYVMEILNDELMRIKRKVGSP